MSHTLNKTYERHLLSCNSRRFVLTAVQKTEVSKLMSQNQPYRFIPQNTDTHYHSKSIPKIRALNIINGN